MIKKLDEINSNQLQYIYTIWLTSNIETHFYINPVFWNSMEIVVKEGFLKANIFIFEHNGEIEGFIGLQDDYIAGLFVKKEKRNCGIGKLLLNEVKKTKNNLILSVYQKNKRAISFYENEGFKIIEEQLDENTNELEYKMIWNHNI
ncbi:GNAT family N-acetyltransferase [Carnobacterium divergens]|uniref:GNAT family N-acetyltransferase n=1 Tax=Carnobacterium divergens TaxID=2748 RepID=UPI0039B05A39